MGYYRAGFTVIGVDAEPQPHYPFHFVQGDAIAALRQWGHLVDVIHASPPCQLFSSMTKMHCPEDHPDLVTPTRKWLEHHAKPYIIENVVGAPLVNPVTLCGSSFGLTAMVGDEKRQLRRHRLFESNVPLVGLECRHEGGTVGVYGKTGGSSKRDGIRFGGVSSWRQAMGIDWMTARELREAIPPAYTEFIGKQLLRYFTEVPLS